MQPLSAFSLEMLDGTYTLGACILLCEVSQKSIRGISRYLGISTKRAKIMHELKKWSVAWSQRAGKSKRLKEVTVNSDLHVGPSSLLLSWKMVHFYHVQSKTLACQEEALYWGVWLKKVTPHLSCVMCATPLNFEGIKRLLALQ